MKTFFDIQYKISQPSLGLDIYLPENSSSPSPALLYYHGGGWIEGDKDGIDNGFKRPIKDALLKKGVAIISVNYRLLDGKERFPSSIEDCLDATRYIRKHAKIYNINPDNIGVLGTSAGAHLAMLQAYADHENFICANEFNGIEANVNYLVNIYGPTELVSLFQLDCMNDDSFPSDMFEYVCHLVKSMSGFDAVTETSMAKKVLHKYSPLSLVKGNIKAQIPTLTLHGEADEIVPITQATDLQDALTAANTESEFYSYARVKHAFAEMSAEQEKVMMQHCLRFIYKYI